MTLTKLWSQISTLKKLHQKKLGQLYTVELCPSKLAKVSFFSSLLMPHQCFFRNKTFHSNDYQGVKWEKKYTATARFLRINTSATHKTSKRGEAFVPGFACRTIFRFSTAVAPCGWVSLSRYHRRGRRSGRVVTKLISTYVYQMILVPSGIRKWTDGR